MRDTPDLLQVHIHVFDHFHMYVVHGVEIEILINL